MKFINQFGSGSSWQKRAFDSALFVTPKSAEKKPLAWPLAACIFLFRVCGINFRVSPHIFSSREIIRQKSSNTFFEMPSLTEQRAEKETSQKHLNNSHKSMETTTKSGSPTPPPETTEPDAALSGSASGCSPLSQALQIVEKKVRNLEKRKVLNKETFFFLIT
jgi:hypothetical protein